MEIVKGKEFSELMQLEPLRLGYEQIGTNGAELVKAISDFSNNEDVIKALKYVKSEPGGSTLFYIAAALFQM